jgi:acetylornithine/N-succinyldiaminopimelate aminotransferase
VRTRSEVLKGHLAKLNERFGLFKEVRGKGLLIGAELTDAWQGRAKDFVTAAGQHGVIMLMAGPDVLRFVPSLIMPLEDMNEGFERLAKAIADVVGLKAEAASK